MSQTLAVGLLALQAAMGFAAAETRTVTLDGTTAEQKWPLKELSPDLPADWSGFDYLVLEFRCSTPQRFQLRLYTADGNRNAGINAFPGAWIRAALPLSIFTQQSRSGSDMASVSNRSRPSYYLNLNGPYGPLTSVQAIGIVMQVPLGKPTFELRSVRLTKDSPGDAVLEPKPLVDELGQWIHAGHRTLDEVKREWAREDETLRAGDFGYCRYGGFAATRAKATGFFRVEKVDGKWWFVDPDGHLFYSTGVDCVRSEMGTRTEGRDGVYTALPPAELGQGSMVSFYTWNLLRRFGAEWKEKWPGPGGAAHVRVGHQHRGQLVGPGDVPAAESLRSAIERTGNGRGLAGHAGRVRGRMGRARGRRRGAAVRCAQRRSVAAGLFHGQ